MLREHNNIQVLDCTLRDGGRIINCDFSDRDITGITKALVEARIDIIELGFLRNNIRYMGNSTFFTDISQLKKYMIQTPEWAPMYVVFTDYGMFDYGSLPERPEMYDMGIRIGFKKQDMQNIIPILKDVGSKGYKVFVQPVNALSYTEKDFEKLIDLVNGTGAYSFGIVDTYGAMYPEDMLTYFELAANGLDPNICIDFHSHNNYQLSFALFQEIVKFNHDRRQLIIDATLNGMGKCAGNLNTELAVDYLIRKKGMDYRWDIILDAIDEYVYPIKEQYEWGYSIPAFLAGMFKSHPNNIIYLTEKFRMDTKDIKNIMGRIDESTRQIYDYGNIDKIYIEYFERKVDDSTVLFQLKQRLEGRKVLVIIPGYSLHKYEARIKELITQEGLAVINLNFCFWDDENAFVFYGNKKRYKQNRRQCHKSRTIITSNIVPDNPEDLVVEYSRCIANDKEYFENSMFMLLNLLNRIEIKEICFAGLDGYKDAISSYYMESDVNYARSMEIKGRDLNSAIKKFLEEYKKSKKLSFITPSQFDENGELEYEM